MKKSDIEYFRVHGSKYANKLIKRKTAANSFKVLVFEVLVFEVLGLNFLDTRAKISPAF